MGERVCVVEATVGAAGTLGGGTLSAPKLDIQLKCTSDPGVIRPDSIVWQMERRHYDLLRAKSSVPHILVVLVLPENEQEWIEHSAEQLMLRRCAWWVKMTGMPQVSTASKTVHLPRKQVFSPDTLRSLMEKISREESL